MLFYEPPPTQADVHFRLFGFPVRVSPWFWIVALMFGVSGGPADPVQTLLWVSVIFVSVLVHELGHAFLQRKFGGHPRVTLHGFGGQTICEDCDHSPGKQIVVSLAGPLAGFCLAGLVVLILVATGHFERFRLSMLPVQWVPYDIGQPGTQSFRDELILMLLFVNIFWGAINLLPIYPLDGGRVTREVFTLGNPRQGIVASLWLSVFTAAAVAAYALWAGWFVMIILFGYLAYLSYRTIAAYEQHWRGGP